MNLLSSCAVCAHPLVDVIHRKMTEGLSDPKISSWLKAENQYVSRITLGNHRRNHMTEEHIKSREALAKRVQSAIRTESASGDLAKLVSGYVYKMVENGDLMPTLSEGLRAQEMLDRRKDKDTDRALALTMAGVLGGIWIEGNATEVNNEQ